MKNEDKDNEVLCLTCGSKFVKRVSGFGRTLVGYMSNNWPTVNCNHDDNCIDGIFECENGHREKLSIINRCQYCGWTGKKECFCSRKIERWPTVKQ